MGWICDWCETGRKEARSVKFASKVEAEWRVIVLGKTGKREGAGLEGKTKLPVCNTLLGVPSRVPGGDVNTPINNMSLELGGENDTGIKAGECM